METIDSVRDHYYSITKRILLFAGQWPYQRKRMRLFGVTLVTVITVSLIIPQVGKFIQCNRDMHCIIVTVPSSLLTTMIMVKLYTCQFNSNKIKDLIDRLNSDWEKLETLQEYEIMKTYAANGKLISKIYSLYCLIASAVFMLATLTPHILDIVLPLNESRPIIMPYEAYYFIDHTQYYFYIFFHALVGVEIAMMGLLAHDCMLFTYIEHVCSIFAVAGFRFENIAYNEHIDSEVMKNNPDDIYRQRLAFSIHMHWRALKFAELVEDTFCATFAVQTMIITVGISITLLEITLQSHSITEVARYAAFVLGELIHLFSFSLQGQKLIDHSVQMRDKIYNCSWYEIPVKSQRLFLHVMERSLQPSFLSAGKIYIFSFKSFTTVLQTSMSYFTVLASFQ